MTVYVMHTEPAHPKCPWGRRFVHEVIHDPVHTNGYTAGLNQFGCVVVVPTTQIIWTKFGYLLARQRAHKEFHESRRS